MVSRFTFTSVRRSGCPRIVAGPAPSGRAAGPDGPRRGNGVVRRLARCDRGPVGQAEQTPDVPTLVRSHVDHAVARLLRPEEIDSWQIRWGTDDASGRRFLCADGLDTFTDGLEDFIAESRFAGGQQRLLTDRPWRQD